MVGPAGVGIGLEEAEVADGGFGEFVEGLETVEGVNAPAGTGTGLRAGVALPIEGGLPSFNAKCSPSL